MRDEDTGFWVVVGTAVLALVVFGPGVWIANKLGADWEVCVKTFWQSAGWIAAIAVAGRYFFNAGPAGIASAAAVLVWPTWHKVLDSMAANAAEAQAKPNIWEEAGDSFAPAPWAETTPPPEIWYTVDWFQWGIEALLIAFVVYRVVRITRSSYGYA